MKAFRSFVLIILCLRLGILHVIASEPSQSVILPWPKLSDLKGAHLDLQTEREAIVIVFLTTECPIARGSMPELNRLASTFLPRKVGFYGAWRETGVTAQAAQKHFDAYKATFPVIDDQKGLLARLLRPTHIPEAFVLSPQGEVLYRGAINNAYLALGKRRAHVEKHYVEEALNAVLQGKRPAVARTEPVGCLFEIPEFKDRK